jgi:chromosome segregation ATPase
MEQKKVVKKVVKKNVNESFVDKIKKNWKNILLIILVIFSVSKCTSSCTRGRQIDRLNYQIVQMDSVITSNGIELDKLNTRLDDAQTSIDSYKGIATGNQRDLVDKVSTLSEENKNLQKQVNSLTKENGKLKNKVSELEDALRSTDDN